MPEFVTPLIGLLMSTGLAGLIGLEREMRFQKNQPDGSHLGGLRTHSMSGALGFLAVFMSEVLEQPALLIAILIVTTLFLLVSHTLVAALQKRFGITSELSLIASFSIGILVGIHQPYIALAVSILFTGLLALKIGLHRIVKKINHAELLAILQFFILSAIILPLLPKSWIDPFGFFDWRPQTVWLMVIFVASIRFIGYFLSKFFGSEKSILLSGIVGGFVSSTAVTMGISQESKGKPQVLIFLIPILVASAIMFFRVLLEVLVVAPSQTELLMLLIPALASMGALLLFVSAILVVKILKKTGNENPNAVRAGMEIRQPLQMRSALSFGVFFLLVLLFADKIAEFFPDSGLFFAAAIAGLTDVDAITLAVANLAQTGQVNPEMASQVILLAVAVNTLVKAGLVFIFGSRKLFRFVFYSVGGVLCVGMIVLVTLL